jgi:hypothetical protein
MCNPAAALGAQLGMTAIQHISAQNAAVEQANRQNALYIENVNNSRVAATDEVRALNRRADQEGQSTAQRKFQNQIETIKLREKKKTAALERGVLGNSVQSILQDVGRRGSFNEQTMERNLGMTLAQINDQKEGTKATFMNRVNSVQKGYAPDAGDAMLGMVADMGMQVAGSYMMYSGMSPTTTPNPTGAVIQGGTGNAAANATKMSYTDWLFKS